MLRSVLFAVVLALTLALALGSPSSGALQPVVAAAPDVGPVEPQPTTPEVAAAEVNPAEQEMAAQLAGAAPALNVEDRITALEELVVELSFKMDQALNGRLLAGSGINDAPAAPNAVIGGDLPLPATPAAAEENPLEPDVGLPIVAASASLSDSGCTKQSMFVSSVESALCPPQRPYRLCTGAIGAGNALCFTEPTSASMIAGNSNTAFFY